MLPATTSTPPTTDGTVRVRHQGIATAVAGAVAFVAGTVVYAVASAGLGGISSRGYALLSPQLLVWSASVLGLGFLARRLADVGFAVTSVALAPVATLLGVFLAQGWAGVVTSWLMPVFLIWQAAGLMGAALIGAISGVLVARRTQVRPAAATDSPRTALTITAIGVLVVGSALAFALPMQWFDVYFSIGQPAPDPTPTEGLRYLWTAGLALAFLLAALVMAALRRGRGLIVLTSVALVCALVGAFVFQVPKGRFTPEPIYDDDRPHPVCYGTTGDCPGG